MTILDQPTPPTTQVELMRRLFQIACELAGDARMFYDVPADFLGQPGAVGILRDPHYT